MSRSPKTNSTTVQPRAFRWRQFRWRIAYTRRVFGRAEILQSLGRKDFFFQETWQCNYWRNQRNSESIIWYPIYQYMERVIQWLCYCYIRHYKIYILWTIYPRIIFILVWVTCNSFGQIFIMLFWNTHRSRKRYPTMQLFHSELMSNVFRSGP